MSVLTHKEYVTKTKKELPVVLVKQEVPVVVEKAKVISEYMYYLLHPENGVEDLQNFEDEIIIGGKSYKRICVNGVIKTKEVVLKDFLVMKGYILMESVLKV